MKKLFSFLLVTLLSLGLSAQTSNFNNNTAKLDASGNYTVTGTLAGTNLPAIPSATFLPTPVHITNVSASTARPLLYTRIGNMVIFPGRIDVDITTTLLATEVQLNLPIASDFTDAGDAAGTGSGGRSIQDGDFAIYADATTNRLLLYWTGQVSTANQFYWFTGMYQIK